MTDLATVIHSTAFKDVTKPITSATGLPNICYIDDAFYRYEQTTLFRPNWVAIGFGKDVPEPGWVKPLELAGVPLLITRTPAGQINVFQNVCRHRGMILVDSHRKLRGPITCPYHAWAYDLDGALRKTPHIGGPDNNSHAAVPHCDYPLIKVRAHLWMDVIFVNLDGSAPPFEVAHADLIARWHEFNRDWHHSGADSSFALTVKCNWKLAVENYCESYHLPFVHPGLNSYSRLEDHYDIMDARNYAGQGSHVYTPQISDDGRQFPAIDGLSEKWRTGAEYVALFPNLLLGVHRDHMFAIILRPEGPDRTTEQVEIYYADPAASGPDFAAMRQTNTRLWHDIFIEDIGVVEGMQKGRHADGYDGGKFSPVMDGPTHHFHHWVATVLMG